MRLYGPGAQRLQIHGTFEADLKYKRKSHKDTIYVLENQQTSLLSRLACEKLGHVKCQLKQQSEVSEVTKDIRTGFLNLSKGLGMLNPDHKPTCISVPRRIHIPLRDKTKLKLEEMDQQGVISSVTETTTWCSGMVPVLKPSEDVRGQVSTKQSGEKCTPFQQ